MIGRTTETLLAELLDTVVRAGASDLHLSVKRVPTIRVDGKLALVRDVPKLSEEDVTELVRRILGPEQGPAFFAQRREADVSFEQPRANLRFRVNVYWAGSEPAIALRALPKTIPSLRELNLPESLLRFTQPRQGFVLLVGPSGHGKTTTMASLVNHINRTRAVHIITIEDPVEYVFTEEEALIHQREVGEDTPSFPVALRAALREDPNVVMIGEMRDLETIATALSVAETGHLVFATLHTNDAAQAIDRVVDAYSAESKAEVRIQLAATLTGIVSQRLLLGVGGGRVPAVEVLVATPAVRNLIREGETAQIPGIIQTGASQGMITLEQSIKALIRGGAVAEADALPYLAGWYA